jgi:hypothetical protein
MLDNVAAKIPRMFVFIPNLTERHPQLQPHHGLLPWTRVPAHLVFMCESSIPHVMRNHSHYVTSPFQFLRTYAPYLAIMVKFLRLGLQLFGSIPLTTQVFDGKKRHSNTFMKTVIGFNSAIVQQMESYVESSLTEWNVPQEDLVGMQSGKLTETMQERMMHEFIFGIRPTKSPSGLRLATTMTTRRQLWLCDGCMRKMEAQPYKAGDSKVKAVVTESVSVDKTKRGKKKR